MVGLRQAMWKTGTVLTTVYVVITCLGKVSTPEAMKVARETYCSPLKNHQSHSTLRVQVGTPNPGRAAQFFDLIADTGSSSVIVTNCMCKKNACWSYSSPCFKGSNSSSFSVPQDSKGDVAPVSMTFGSGQIFAVLATDVVSVDRVKAVMNKSLLMLYDHQLDAGITNFEGIFGVGIPYHEGALQQTGASWLELADVKRFSMCFSGIKEDGMFKMSTPAQTNAMGSIGVLHWGLEFRGISIGAATAPVAFCDPAKKPPNQKTACGMIPDSGTTLILGPRNQVAQLYASLCDAWPRCAEKFAARNATAHSEEHESSGFDSTIARILRRWGLPIPAGAPFALSPEEQAMHDKEMILKSVLESCAQWAHGPADLDAQLPPVHLHVAGIEGHTQTLLLTGSSYVVTANTGDGKIACMPFFGSFSYNTAQNGPIWIVGTPLFYDYEVHYDLSSSPPSMSFTKSQCGTCSHDGAALPTVGLARKSNAIRQHDVPVRMPNYDTSLPL
eukprot:TRINITY_DN102876_c0_g1_i1.p1 TRINITY_DN102876_c0_g1~~TRINITY_DN102876_c0_g1_i1.p1  ORF type:complete len:500 (-),score=67.72 TRINITY_DN102876_c0_g1_i1:101-1600(-)